jgi:hypothetical protein
MKDKIKEFAKAHKKEILKWQDWLRKQSGKLISEIDWASEPKFIKKGKKNG